MGPKTVEVEWRDLHGPLGRRVAAGTQPGGAPDTGAGDVDYWTNREIMQVEVLPASLTFSVAARSEAS